MPQPGHARLFRMHGEQHRRISARKARGEEVRDEHIIEEPQVALAPAQRSASGRRGSGRASPGRAASADVCAWVHCLGGLSLVWHQWEVSAGPTLKQVTKYGFKAISQETIPAPHGHSTLNPPDDIPHAKAALRRRMRALLCGTPARAARGGLAPYRGVAHRVGFLVGECRCRQLCSAESRRSPICCRSCRGSGSGAGGRRFSPSGRPASCGRIRCPTRPLSFPALSGS